MDPVGPWYPSYNRLGVQAGTGAGELHHPLATTTAAGASATTTAQLLPGGFLSPPPVAYETVFSPLFHHAAAAGAKPAAHYVTQHRAQALVQAAATKQSTDGEFHPQAQAFFEQGAPGAWQQNSPFGILPHESVVAAATSTSKTTSYENFNAHFAAAQSLNNHINSQLAASSKSAANRAQSPQVSTATSSKANASQTTPFFQVPASLSETSTTAKTFTSTNTTNLQQSCIVSSPSTTISKEYRGQPQQQQQQQSSSARTFINSPTATRALPSKQQANNAQPAQIQTKAQTKIYSELSTQQERQRNSEENQSQSSPISFSIMDAPGRLNYSGSNSSGKRPTQFQHNYRHYQQSSNSEDFQRPKSGSDYQTNGSECANVVVPRRPSPLQAHSQASPLGHAQSPAYPMYNSPMNSMSSPQQNSSNQVAPPSPLDVSVPRPNSQTGGSVAYPSVITRALNSDKSFPERYERPQQNCWDERQRKFQTNSNSYTANSTIENQQRQQYFDSSSGHQVTLQDLSSCRGDPMSIVKNLQQQQQSCQVPQPAEIKQEVKPAVKRRKSAEKPSSSTSSSSSEVHITSRVPPPAHSTGAAQQQQNGVYFDFDRWNLPPPTSKIFPAQALHQAQHQGLMVGHPHGHHPPPPLPYFAPFHLPNHPSEFSATMELTPLTNYNEQPAQATNQFQQQEDQPKVVVPNIEEELNFLSGVPDTTTRPSVNNHHSKPQTLGAITKPSSDKPSGVGAGFMSSYLKFLQGERDTSPPPAVRGGRKQTWTRKPLEGEKPPETNGVPAAPYVPPGPPQPIPVMRLSQGDPQDDPRYFPLPKERKKDVFNSSDDGFSSDDDFFGGRKAFKSDSSKEKDKFKNKNRSPKMGGQPDRKKFKTDKLHKHPDGRSKDKFKDMKVKHLENVPKREQTKRAVKGKNSLSDIIKEENEPDEPPEFQDSEDSDPAWTPAASNDEEVCLPVKKKGRGRPAGTKNKKSMKNLIAAAAQGAGISDTDGYTSDPTKKKLILQKKQSVPTLEDNIAASLHNSFSPSNEDNPFKPGEFVAIKSELNQEWPAIWRVDGKTLLQKYEPFEQNGTTLYRNISTYTSWTPESKKQYISVPVKYRSQGQLETIVEFLKDEMTVIDHEFHEKCMKDSEKYQDNFEVYIQTLISQALDSNFLMEIFQEKDEYFLTNVQTIDDITATKKQQLLGLLRWPPSLQAAVCTWPCFNVIREVSSADAQTKSCAACAVQAVAVRVLMYGQPYNATTLEGCQPDPNAINEKDFFMCRICASRVELSSKVTHQKYLMYIECAKRVSEKRTSDPTKDTTSILNELLADESWLNQLFYEVRTLWAEIDCIEDSFKSKNSVSAQ